MVFFLGFRLTTPVLSDAIIGMLDAESVEFTISVPFERFSELKHRVEERRRWQHLNNHCGFFQSRWKPKSWGVKQRFVFIRTRNRKQYKEPAQLDLFIPYLDVLKQAA